MTRRSETLTIFVHCSATRPSRDIGRREIREWHIAQGWSDIGYAAVIRRNGLIEFGRHFDDIGAQVQGRNSTSVGVCLIGGLYENGKEAVDDFGGLFTPAQGRTLANLLTVLVAAYPGAQVCGHRDASPDTNNDGKVEQREWLKSCPGFDVVKFCKLHGI